MNISYFFRSLLKHIIYSWIFFKDWRYVVSHTCNILLSLIIMMEALIFIRTNWWTFSSFWPRYIQLLFLTSHWKLNAVCLFCPLAMSFVIWINNITLADFHLRINELLVLLQDAHTFVNIEPLSLYPFSVRYFNGIFYLYSIFGNTWLRIWIKAKFLCWLLICGIMVEGTAF